MTKTLRITSILAASLAAVFIAFTAFFGVRSDEQAEKFLSSPGVIEKFRRNMAKGNKGKGSKDQASPLVGQARAFALYLNPPPKPARKKAEKPTEALRPQRRKIDPKPRASSAKFKLVATSYFAQRPELSLALLDLPGKGLRWVRQSDMVGHLVLEEVGEGHVFVRDGEKISEVAAERRPKKSLLKGSSSVRTGPKSTSSLLRKTGAGITGSRVPQITPEESTTLMEKVMSELGAMQKGVGADGTDSQDQRDLGTSLMEKLISQFEAMRVGAEEAKKLDRLGKELGDAQQDPNRPKSRKVETSRLPAVKRGRRLNKPSSKK